MLVELLKIFSLARPLVSVGASFLKAPIRTFSEILYVLDAPEWENWKKMSKLLFSSIDGWEAMVAKVVGRNPCRNTELQKPKKQKYKNQIQGISEKSVFFNFLDSYWLLENLRNKNTKTKYFLQQLMHGQQWCHRL